MVHPESVLGNPPPPPFFSLYYNESMNMRSHSQQQMLPPPPRNVFKQDSNSRCELDQEDLTPMFHVAKRLVMMHKPTKCGYKGHRQFKRYLWGGGGEKTGEQTET